VEGAGIRAPADAAAPPAQQHVRDLGPGELVTRYDERLLSNTKLSFMYTPGSGPVTFEVDGLRFGHALGIEVHFPDNRSDDRGIF
jgi:predicted amidohydrolase